MRFSNIALAASAVSSVLAADSICDKYTMALLKENSGKNQYTLLTLLVNTAVIGNFTGPGTKNSDLPGSMVDVPGILAPGMYKGEKVNLLPYFDGSLASTNFGGHPGVVNFLDGGGATPIIKDPTSSGKEGSAQYTLLTHLYQYFGALLGCSKYGEMGFPAYGGSNSQYEVHRYMDLDNAEVEYFIEQVGLAAASFGVSEADIKTAGTALMKTFGYRCAPAASVVPGGGSHLQSICVANDCPVSPNSDCSAYAPEMMPAKAGMSSMPPFPTGSASASAAPPMGTGAGGSSPTVSAMPSGFTGNAAASNGVPAGLIAAGAFAIAML